MSKYFKRREFLIVSPTAITSPNFPLKGIAGSTGRLDVIARAILVAKTLKTNAYIIVKALLLGPPKPPLLLEVHIPQVNRVYDNEVEVISDIRKAMMGERVNGFYIERISFKHVLSELVDVNKNVYYLHEKGDSFKTIRPSATIAFILGSHVDIPAVYERIIDQYGIKRVSLGNVSYLTSQCIIIVNWLLDVFSKPLFYRIIDI